MTMCGLMLVPQRSGIYQISLSIVTLKVYTCMYSWYVCIHVFGAQLHTFTYLCVSYDVAEEAHLQYLLSK